MTIRPVDPLLHNVPIVDAGGRPTAQFSRLWMQARTVDEAVVSTADSVSGLETGFEEHAAATTGVHGITDTGQLILEGDARLFDARTPLSHGASHAAGSDTIPLAGYSLAQLGTRNAADLTGTLNDAQLSTNIPRLNATSSQWTGFHQVTRNQPSNTVLAGRITGNAFASFQLNANGERRAGDGTAAPQLIERVVGTSAFWLSGTNATYAADNLAVASGNGTVDRAGGSGVLATRNAVTVPNTNPVNGYVEWAEAGAKKGRGASGTVTTIGPADPHCPTCGRDFALEWESASETGGHLAVCVWCLLEDVAEALGRPSKGLINKSTTPRASFPLTRSPWHANMGQAR